MATERQQKAREFVAADIRDAAASLASARKLLDETGLPERVLAPIDRALDVAIGAAQTALNAARFPAEQDAHTPGRAPRTTT